MQSAQRPSPAVFLSAITGLYIGQSIIGGITWTGLPAVMRSSGVALDRIGLVSLIALPWVLKFLWAPIVERYRLPKSGGNRSGVIISIGGLISVVGLICVGAIDPSNWIPLFALLMAIAFAAATVDIACDGFAVESLAQKHHGWGNAAQVGGAYLGAALGGGLFLFLVGIADWRIAVWMMAGVLLALGLPFLLGIAGRLPQEARDHVPSLAHALGRPLLRRGLMVAAAFVFAQKIAMGMVGPLLVDRGVDLITIGVLNGVGSLLVGSVAALLGGVCVSAWGTRPVLVLALFLQAGLMTLFAIAGFSGRFPIVLMMIMAIASTSAVMAFGFVALYAQFMRWSDPRQAGIDFTLFQSMDALVSMVGGMLAGQLAQAFGYGAFFSAAAVMAIVVVPLIVRLPAHSGDGAAPAWCDGHPHNAAPGLASQSPAEAETRCFSRMRSSEAQPNPRQEL